MGAQMLVSGLILMELLRFNTIDDLNHILNNLKPEDYDKRTIPMEKNFKNSKPYYDYFERVFG